jgi:hypothetical protein
MKGPEPFSEPETQAIRDLISILNFSSAMNFHAYGNLWITPYNYFSSDNYFDMMSFKHATWYTLYADVLHNKNFKYVGNAQKMIKYTANGEASDWMLSKKNIIAMSPELGLDSKATQRFYIDPKDIGRSVEKDYLAVQEFIKHSEPLIMFSGYGWVEAGEKEKSPVFKALVDIIRKLFQHESIDEISRLIWANKRYILEEFAIEPNQHEIVIQEQHKKKNSKNKHRKKHSKSKKTEPAKEKKKIKNIEEMIPNHKPEETPKDNAPEKDKEIKQDQAEEEEQVQEQVQEQSKNTMIQPVASQEETNEDLNMSATEELQKENFAQYPINENVKNPIPLDQSQYPYNPQYESYQQNQNFRDGRRLLAGIEEINSDKMLKLNEYKSLSLESIQSLIKNTKSETLKKGIEEYLVSFQTENTYLMIFEQKSILDLKNVNPAFEFGNESSLIKININSLKIHTIDSKKFKMENENSKDDSNKTATDISEIIYTFDLKYKWNKGNTLISDSAIDLPKRSILIFEIGFDNRIDVSINLLLIKSGKIFYNQNKILKLMELAPKMKIKKSIIEEEKNEVKKDDSKTIESITKEDKSKAVIKGNESTVTDNGTQLTDNANTEKQSEDEKEASNVSPEEFKDYLYVLFIFVFLFSLLLIGRVCNKVC